jgi:aldose 1-epimerase
MPDIIELIAGDARCVLRPDIGGAVAGLWLANRAVLRSTDPEALHSARDAGCFALLPYSNRLGYRRFSWKGKTYTTAANQPDEPHSIHGVGWMSPWTATHAGPAEVSLQRVHAADENWPFAFEATQTLSLTPDALSFSLALTNTDTVDAPAGLGWHPAFPRRQRSRMRLDLTDRWDTDASLLPVRKVSQPGIDADVAVLDFNHCFEGWTGAASIRDETLSLRLSSSLNRVVVYTPHDQSFFCVEPVSHVSNAIHMAEPAQHGLVTLAPGATLTASMRLEFAHT